MLTPNNSGAEISCSKTANVLWEIFPQKIIWFVLPIEACYYWIFLVIWNALQKHDYSQTAFQTTSPSTWEAQQRQGQKTMITNYLKKNYGLPKLHPECSRSIIWTIICSNGFSKDHGKNWCINRLLFFFSFSCFVDFWIHI